MNTLFRGLLSLTPVKRAVFSCLAKPKNPFYLAVVFHTEKIQDRAVFEKMLALGKSLPFRPTACVMTPENPLVKKDMLRLGTSEEEFRERLSRLAEFYEIGYHGHFCRPAAGPAPAGADPLGLGKEGFELTLEDPEELRRQFAAEYAYLERNTGRPQVYSAGWWLLNRDVVSLLEEHAFSLDCSVRRGYPDSLGRRYVEEDAMPPRGYPFPLPPSGKITEVPSVFYLHMNWWTVLKELFPLITSSKGPLFAVLPTHDFNLPDGGEKIAENIRLLSGIPNVKFLELSRLRAAAGESWPEGGLAPSSCPVCGPAGKRALWKDGQYRAVECGTCGLIYLDPQPRGLETIFDETYYRNNYLPAAQARTSFFGKRLLEINALGKAGGRSLDIGCGPGYFVAAAGKAGWDAHGLEPSPFASAYASAELGLKVSSGTLTRGLYPEGSFDLVTLWDVIAHLPDPAACVREIGLVMKKDGILAVSTTLRTRFTFRLAALLSRFVNSTYYVHAPQQVFHFSPENLSKLLDKAGFETVRVKFIGAHVPWTAGLFTSGLSGGLSRLAHLVTDRLHFHNYYVVYARKRA